MRRAVVALIALVPFLTPVAPAAARAVPRLGMVCTQGPEFDLTADAGHIETPDGSSVLMWSYRPTDGDFQSPGPVLCVEQGDQVTIRLRNELPEPVSIVLPGQSGVRGAGAEGLLAREAPPGGEAVYTFTASQPGTYLYESGTDPAKQIEMGLAGALVVRPAGHPDQVYDEATRFDPAREYLLVLGAIDPDLHHAVETGGGFDLDRRRARYFSINGRQFPDTIHDNGAPWLPAQPYGSLVRVRPYDAASNPLPALIRVINADVDNHPFHPHGNHVRQVGKDGRPLRTPAGADASGEHFARTLGAGQTEDYLFTWRDRDGWDPGRNPLPASVAAPDYRKLFFSDGNTWYSGSAYLGATGTLPIGTASQNLCGEWYFPWHSHALHEFANYDASFGGMATLLRVDPANGCAATPAVLTSLGGTAGTGAADALGAIDGAYYEATGTGGTDWQAGFAGVPSGAGGLTITYTGRNSLSALTTTLWIWKWSTREWVRLGETAASVTTDVTLTRKPQDAAAFVGTGADRGKVRVRVLTEGTEGSGSSGSSGSTASPVVTRADLLRLTYDAP
ncbi:multicopper oxidase domain-containing protein [Spongiactinospora sp. TRM90649]|uniref:multicopper oxidase domain-containing protein n=1 Tax=Spongiactinospora sp. TRM90649 TaxID=3031114 RepID=UPI0023F7DDAE|nr:multicopper oxidase domain-containing protein [Spongiactinospora sp. TRM90649]MDF5755581.1 multicopper oxidase domain-containing protein [Spongiactinospora sp. TRM90649]